MSNTFRIEIEKFNGQNFELWKLKMEYLLVDKEQWIAIEPRMILTHTLKKEQNKLDKKLESSI